MITAPQYAPILIVENDTGDGMLLTHAIRNAGIENPLVRLPDAAIAELYLDGTGQYSNRKTYPLPCLILMDVTLPKLMSVEMLPWLKSPPTSLQIVVTTVCGPLDPSQFESAVAFSPNSVLCNLPTPESLAGMINVLETVITPENSALAAA